MAGAAHSNPCAVHHQGFWQRPDEGMGLRANYGHISTLIVMHCQCSRFSIQVRVFQVPWFLRKLAFDLTLLNVLAYLSWPVSFFFDRHVLVNIG